MVGGGAIDVKKAGSKRSGHGRCDCSAINRRVKRMRNKKKFKKKESKD